MFETTTGVVLRVRRLTESSLIVNWLAPEGRISTVAKGALRPKSPFRGKLDLFFVGEFSFSRSRRSELHTLREVRLVHTNPIFRTHLDALQQASYCAAFIEQTTESDTALPGMFELMCGLLNSYGPGTSSASAERVLAFELRMLSALGLEPDWGESRLSPAARDGARHLQTAPWDEVARTTLPAQMKTELRRFLHGFLIYNFGRLARGREGAVAV